MAHYQYAPLPSPSSFRKRAHSPSDKDFDRCAKYARLDNLVHDKSENTNEDDDTFPASFENELAERYLNLEGGWCFQHNPGCQDIDTDRLPLSENPLSNQAYTLLNALVTELQRWQNDPSPAMAPALDAPTPSPTVQQQSLSDLTLPTVAATDQTFTLFTGEQQDWLATVALFDETHDISGIIQEMNNAMPLTTASHAAGTSSLSSQLPSLGSTASVGSDTFSEITAVASPSMSNNDDHHTTSVQSPPSRELNALPLLPSVIGETAAKLLHTSDSIDPFGLGDTDPSILPTRSTRTPRYGVSGNDTLRVLRSRLAEVERIYALPTASRFNFTDNGISSGDVASHAITDSAESSSTMIPQASATKMRRSGQRAPRSERASSSTSAIAASARSPSNVVPQAMPLHGGVAHRATSCSASSGQSSPRSSPLSSSLSPSSTPTFNPESSSSTSPQATTNAGSPFSASFYAALQFVLASDPSQVPTSASVTTPSHSVPRPMIPTSSATAPSTSSFAFRATPPAMTIFSAAGGTRTSAPSSEPPPTTSMEVNDDGKRKCEYCGAMVKRMKEHQRRSVCRKVKERIGGQMDIGEA
ncbi:hypothetical protein V5O48_011226 [Marasmius crinis-equi]|uniref:Uncharacterized protein n=1 Tax=Marasmius crinis-equi TaxID=585013 RepID=A0ABR3F666_9AGAR